MQTTLLRISILALALVSCSDGFTSEEQATIDKAMATLKDAPQTIQTEVLRTCEKWKHNRRPCENDAVRLAQMECWIEMGLPHLKAALKRNMRPRARDRKTLQHHNLCMERRGWRFRRPTKNYL